jgi:hypothetical protein
VEDGNAMQVFKIKFGLNEDKGDSFGIRFSGDKIWRNSLWSGIKKADY